MGRSLRRDRLCHERLFVGLLLDHTWCLVQLVVVVVIVVVVIAVWLLKVWLLLLGVQVCRVAALLIFGVLLYSGHQGGFLITL